MTTPIAASPLRAVEIAAAGELLLSDQASSSCSASADEDSNDLDLKKILEEVDDAPMPEAWSFSSPERRRAELDELLEKADELARSAPASRDLSGLIASPAPDELMAENRASSCQAAWDAACDAGAGVIGEAETAAASHRSGTGIVRSLSDAEAAEQRALRGEAGNRVLPASLRSRAGTSSAAERHRLGLGLLRVAALERMADEVGEHLERGRPTAIALHANFVAVGTSFGHVLIFDRRQTLQTTLWLHAGAGAAASTSLSASLASSLTSSFIAGRRPAPSVSMPGPVVDAVTALRMAEGSSLLLCGHMSGAVVLWDVSSGAILKECPSLHDASISHIRFMHPSRPHALTCDAGGTTHLLTFSRLLLTHTEIGRAHV